MKKLLAIGEALIDFIPQQSEVSLQEVDGFLCRIGGAPANVCAAFAKLGGSAALLSQVGSDAFGDKIIAELKKAGVSTSYIRQTTEARTSLAFVSLKAEGERDFVFYRDSGADMLFRKEYVLREYFDTAFALHFCSVSLGDTPMLEAHRQAIEYALSCGCIVSFDPNIRPALWPDREKLLQTIKEFIPYAHVIKVSQEELSFIANDRPSEEAVTSLFRGNVKLVLLTKGADGAEAYTTSACAKVNAHTVNAVDTTGAGDAFIGSFLYQLYQHHCDAAALSQLPQPVLAQMLRNSCRYCEASVQHKGAIDAYPTFNQLHAIGWIEQNND